MKFSIYQGSRQGPRAYNQDRLAHAYTRSAILLVLADGMGGHVHGELAAEIAVKGLVEAFEREAQPFIKQPAQFFRQTILHTHQAINRLRQQLGLSESPRTTIVVGLLQHNMLLTAHVGDSRLYLYRQGLIEYQTQDHSVVQSLIRDGKIRPEQANSHPHRHRIYNCLGGEPLPSVTLSDPIKLREGDVLMLCSDGVWNSVPEVQLAQHLLATRIEEGISGLLDSAETASKVQGDNMSAIGLQWGKRLKAAMTLPVTPSSLADNKHTDSANGYVRRDLSDEEIARALNLLQPVPTQNNRPIKHRNQKP